MSILITSAFTPKHSQWDGQTGPDHVHTDQRRGLWAMYPNFKLYSQAQFRVEFSRSPWLYTKLLECILPHAVNWLAECVPLMMHW